MKTITLLTAAVLVGGTTALVSATTSIGSGTAFGASTATLVVADGEYEALATEYDEADAAYKAMLKTATKEERRALRKQAPVKTFWDRFGALAEKGDGQSMLWMVDHVRENRDIRSKERGAVLAPLYRGLFDQHSDAKWFSSVLSSLQRDSKYVGTEATLALYEQAIGKSKNDDTVAASLYFAAKSVESSDPKKAAEYMDRIIADYANTVYGTAARAANAKPEDSEVGKVAPDFVGKTIDGFQFALDDYRGKVVVLDFYGFW